MFSFTQKKKTVHKNSCGVVLNADGFHLVGVNNQTKRSSNLFFNRKVRTTSELESKQLLKQHVQRAGLVGCHCSWILNPSDYKLLMLDLPRVPDNEIKEALKWQILEMVEYSEEEILIDIMSLPHLSVAGVNKKIYAVVADKNFILKKTSIIESSGLDLSVIDIAENSIKQVVSATKGSDQTIAFITELSGNLTLIICQDNFLLLTRRLSVTFDATKITDQNTSLAENEQDLEQEEDETKKSSLSLIPQSEAQSSQIQQLPDSKASIKSLQELGARDVHTKHPKTSQSSLAYNLANEIQRSFNYCASTLGITAPESIYLADIHLLNEIRSQLDAEVPQSVYIFNCKEFFELQCEIDANCEYMLPFGGALRGLK